MIRTLPLLALLAACGTDAVAPSSTSSGADTCGAAAFSGLVGQPIGDGAAFLDAGVGYRVIYPDDAVTEDFDPERINVNVDATGVIQNLNCG